MTGPGPWAQALDAFAAALAEQEHLLASQRYAEIRPYQPPADLGPLPPALADRARLLAAEARALTEEAQRALHASARHLSLMRRIASEQRPHPAYLDQLV